MKKCNKCKVEKSLSEFHKDKYSKDGVDYRCKQCRANYFQNNKETYKKRTAKWKEDNIDRWREQDSLRQKQRRKEKPYLIKWRSLLENTLRRLNKPKETSTHNLLKYSALDLKKHLESLGMIWGYHHVDHKIPVTWFKENTPPYIVNDLRNLQPLSPEKNKTKGNRFNDDVPEDYLKLVEPFLKQCLDL